MIIHLLVEGELDAVVLRRLVEHAGHQVGTTYGKRGFGYIKNKVGSFNGSVHPHFAMMTAVDLMDTGIDCAPRVVRQWLPGAKPCMLFRVVEREIESWILADRKGFAQFASVPTNKIPQWPETTEDPKRELVSICRKYGKKSVAERVVPRANSTASEGPEYNECLGEFVQSTWSIERARRSAESLKRAVAAIDAFPDRCCD